MGFNPFKSKFSNLLSFDDGVNLEFSKGFSNNKTKNYFYDCRTQQLMVN